MSEKSLLIESLENHQKLIDVLLSHNNEIGICEVGIKTPIFVLSSIVYDTSALSSRLQSASSHPRGMAI